MTAGEHNDIDGREYLPVVSKRFPDQVLDAVAVHRPGRLAPADGEAQAGGAGIIAPDHEGQVAPGNARGLAEDASEIALADKPGIALKACARTRPPGHRDSDGKPGTTLGTTRLKDLPSTPGSHTCPEPVGPLALDDARLIGALHDLWLLD